ncbi:MAG: hypothetical protein ACM3WT_07985 [Bacillota bacterium]
MEQWAIEHVARREIISDGVPPGAVQVSGDGQPTILLADRQTTGGYPTIATVISVDLDLLGQARPGDTIRFERVGIEEAHRAVREYAERIDTVPRMLKRRTAGSENGSRRRTYVVYVDGRRFAAEVEDLA